MQVTIRATQREFLVVTEASCSVGLLDDHLSLPNALRSICLLHSDQVHIDSDLSSLPIDSDLSTICTTQ